MEYIVAHLPKSNHAMLRDISVEMPTENDPPEVVEQAREVLRLAAACGAHSYSRVTR